MVESKDAAWGMPSANLIGRSGPIPAARLGKLAEIRDLATRILPRKPSSTVSLFGTTSCAPGDNSGPCEKPVDASSNTTLPIVLGVVIPLTVALVILLVLHRRHVRKLRIEDANDRHKSLDYGLGDSSNAEKRKARNKKTLEEMSAAETLDVVKRGRGLSMDMMTNPYLLPPGLQQSRESLHSLSRTLQGEDDKYRPATTFLPNDGSASYPSSMRSPADDSSSFTGSSRRRFETESNRHLIRQAQRLSRPGSTKSNVTAAAYDPQQALPGPRKTTPGDANRPGNLLAPASHDTMRDSTYSTASTGMNAAMRASNNYLGAFIRGGAAARDEPDAKPKQEVPTSATEQAPASTVYQQVTAPAPAVVKDEQLERRNTGPVSAETARVEGVPAMQYDGSSHFQSQQIPQDKSQDPASREPRLPQLSVAPLSDFQNDFRLPESGDYESPKQDREEPSSRPVLAEFTNQKTPHRSATLPDVTHFETQENRNSEQPSYTEELYDYEDDIGYDPRRLTMGTRPLPPDDPSENPEQRANRIRSFYKEYFDESKPANAQPQVHYYDGSENYEQDYYDEPEYYQMPPPPRDSGRYAGSERHRATHSTGSFMSSPRAMSTASGQWGAQGRRPPPHKKLPPPKPLHNLPTPHMLKDDNFLPMDFAPPKTYKERRAGTPDSLRGGLRPYSPGMRAHNPLASSFDDLSVMPSPHALRKSGTFTGLEFAPPPRIKAPDSGSDSGSIRSNRSAMSAVQLHNIRSGAYRLSRIPKEVAGTKYELADALRPQWDMRKM